jgi:hypothetical protein
MKPCRHKKWRVATSETANSERNLSLSHPRRFLVRGPRLSFALVIKEKQVWAPAEDAGVPRAHPYFDESKVM